MLFLQETVRKECEERYELTEALSEAREQLLALRRPPGEFGSYTLRIKKQPFEQIAGTAVPSA